MFKIEYCATDGGHITLNHDGTIDVWMRVVPADMSDGKVAIDYRQASILRAMVLCADTLEREARR